MHIKSDSAGFCRPVRGTLASLRHLISFLSRLVTGAAAREMNEKVVREKNTAQGNNKYAEWSISLQPLLGGRANEISQPGELSASSSSQSFCRHVRSLECYRVLQQNRRTILLLSESSPKGHRLRLIRGRGMFLIKTMFPGSRCSWRP